MAATTGYAAGIESNAVVLSYASESAWATLPAVAFQAVRIQNESLAPSKTRQRPDEILSTYEDTAATTTQVSAGGTVNFALSFGTYDDWLASMLANDWQALTSIAGAAGDITLTNISGTSATLSSTNASKFTAISVGQWIRTLGFTNTGNNNFLYVSAKASNQSLTVTTPFAAVVTETPSGTAAQIRLSTLSNSTLFKSLYIQKKLASNLFLRYPGAFCTGGSLQGGVGQFLSGSFNLAAQQESSSTTDASTGAVSAAPTGRVHDPVSGFTGVLIDETAVNAGVDRFTLNITRTGAAAEYAMGNAAAAGMLIGSFNVSGSIRMFFKDFTYYTRHTNETLGRISIITKDPSGQAYVVQLLNGGMFNPRILAGGPGQAVYAEWDLEGNPASAGGTLRVDRLVAA